MTAKAFPHGHGIFKKFVFQKLNYHAQKIFEKEKQTIKIVPLFWWPKSWQHLKFGNIHFTIYPIFGDFLCVAIPLNLEIFEYLSSIIKFDFGNYSLGNVLSSPKNHQHRWMTVGNWKNSAQDCVKIQIVSRYRAYIYLGEFNVGKRLPKEKVGWKKKSLKMSSLTFVKSD